MLYDDRYFRNIELRILSLVLNTSSEENSNLRDFMHACTPAELKRYHRIVKTQFPRLKKSLEPEVYQQLHNLVHSELIVEPTMKFDTTSQYLFLPVLFTNADLDFMAWSGNSVEKSFLIHCIRLFARKETQGPLPKPGKSKLHTLSQKLNLTPRQTNILGLLALVKNHSHILRAFSYPDDLSCFEHLYQHIFREPIPLLQREMSRDGDLALAGILIFDSLRYRSNDVPELNPAVMEYLLGYKSTYYDTTILDRLQSGTYGLETFPLDSTQIYLATSLLEHPENPGSVLIAGPPGSGKTELVKSLLGRSSRAMLFKAPSGKLMDQDLFLAASVCNQESKVLVIDEAESLLQTKANMSFFFHSDSLDKKKTMNDFLDSNPGKTVFLLNDIQGVHESTLRRFDQIIHLPAPDDKRRTHVWKSMARKQRVSLGDTFVHELVQRYEVTPGVIHRALSSAQLVPAEKQEQVISKSLESFYKANGKTPRISHQSLPNDPGLIHTDVDLNTLTTILQPWKGTSQSFGASLLFWGLPGTGKTEFARTLARSLEMECMVKKASDILDPYLGMSEKHLSGAFQSAKEKNALLVFDEADSFLYQRTGNQHSWERSLVNEFLSQLETHTGITVCTTNMLTLLDNAGLRRFSWKVQFKPLDNFRLAKALQLYFPNQARQIQTFLESTSVTLELTLGDLASAYKRLQPRVAAGFPLESEHIIDHLVLEVGYRSAKEDLRIVGFGQ